METKLKVTVFKMFTPEDIFGQEHDIKWNGEPIPPCGHKVDEEFIVDHHLNKPEGLCGRAWQVLYTTLMIYYFGGNYGYPEPGVTYQPCGDGVKPVIFKIEKLAVEKE